MKNIFLLLVLSVFCTTSIQAQKFKFGLAVQPFLTDNFLSNDGSVPDEVSDLFSSLEHTTMGYSGYLFTQYTISTRCSVRAGAGYSRMGYEHRRNQLIFAQPEPNLPEYGQSFYTHHDVIVPLLVTYNLTKRKHNFYLLGGLTPQMKISRTKTQKLWYTGGKETTKTEDDHLTDYRNLNVNGSFGFGYDLKLAGNKHLFFQPTFDCNLLGVSKSAGLNRRLYAIGLSIGCIIG